MSKIILKGYIIVPSADLSKVKDELPIHKRLTLAEKGCLTFNVTQDRDNKNRFNVYEEFVDQKSFSAHQDRVRNSKWGKISPNVERHYEVIEVG